ncbi:MBL fold metallo-hydrolase [Leptospira idonii]|uniref:MBL fold metallo-hydrolase n=1 Tax=Leptospira idonii TaxID=1193500 RepID=A0A4R9LXR6_9LEPT|nr:MBL fold metallo-hydrolase [Leptospira idonii]TGN18044.1 MBL fold metallo-hydrolase [Leptospira idonii]
MKLSKTALLALIIAASTAFHISCSWDKVVLDRVKSSISLKEAAAKELFDKDKITVILIGTGTPIPSDNIQNSTAVFVNGQFLVFDSGDGVAMAMEKQHLPITDINGIFITHFHSDHFADLGEVIDRSWLLGRRNNLTVYGPKGTSELVSGFLKSYKLEYGYRTKHHGEEAMPSQWKGAIANEFSLKADGSSKVVYEKDGVIVRSFYVNHEPVEPAVGYRIEYKGKSIVISGDTADSENLTKHSIGADLLISEAMNKSLVAKIEKAYELLGIERFRKIMKDIQFYHIDVEELGRLAEKSKVKTLVVTHMIPAAKGFFQVKSFYKDPLRKEFSGNLIIGQDGQKIILPLD